MTRTDPLHQQTGPDTFWTTVNATEAIPGTTTPLTWSFYDDATELAIRGAFAELGTLRRAEVCAPADPDQRFIGIFHGHPAANMTRFRLLADLTPGGSGDALERQFFGTVRPGARSVSSRRRYPAVAVRMPGAARRVPGRLAAAVEATDRWWRALTAGPVDAPRARAALLESTERYRAVLHWHTVATMLTQGVFDRLAGLTERSGRPGTELELVSGVDLDEASVLADLWALSRDRIGVGGVVARHGFHGRNAGELSVRSWREDPGQVSAAASAYATLSDDRSPAELARRNRERAAQARADFVAGLPLRQRPGAALLLRLVLRYLPLRELGRAGLLRALDGGRFAARRLGADLAAAGALGSADDVFFLTIPELTGPVPADVTDLVALRRKRYREYLGLELPESWEGPPRPRPVDTAPASGRVLSGVAAGPGTVTGPARVVHDPDEIELSPGEVLVCHTTDPSWASVMAMSAGLVIDIGGPLSHGAIVARELGVPCVIGVARATHTVRDGDLLRVDGSAGTVEILEARP